MFKWRKINCLIGLKNSIRIFKKNIILRQQKTNQIISEKYLRTFMVILCRNDENVSIQDLKQKSVSQLDASDELTC